MNTAATWNALPGRFPRRWAAVLCLALFLLLQCFAASGSLHRAIHSDAAASSHHCVITLVAQGQLHAADAAPVLLLFVAVFVFCLPPLAAPIPSSVDCRLSPSRAPPRL